MKTTSNLNSNNNIPDILEVNDINVWSEIPENYVDGKDVDMRVWSLVSDIKQLLESADVWFLTEHPHNIEIGQE